jgi:hypothetical protein
MTQPAAHPLFRPVLIASFALAFEIIHAAYPLVVDDAETQAPGELEAVSAVAYVHYRHDWILAFPLEATVGLVQRVDASVAFGYQFAEFRENGTRKRSDGFMDTLLAVKAQWLEQERHGLSLSLQAGAKLPTASERKGLGSGSVDADALVIATKNWERTSLDANVGYTFSRPFAVQRESDVLFYGFAARHTPTDPLELFGEIFAESPIKDWNGTELLLRAGFQLGVTKTLSWGLAAGTGLRSGSPDLTATTGLTWAY